MCYLLRSLCYISVFMVIKSLNHHHCCSQINHSSFLSLSFKFGRKINYVSYLSELEDVVKCDQLVIPSRVRE